MNHNARLRESLVRQVRRSFANGRSQAAIGRRFHISRSQVWNLVHRKTWKELTDFVGC